jgi:hypothetical protein
MGNFPTSTNSLSELIKSQCGRLNTTAGGTRYWPPSGAVSLPELTKIPYDLTVVGFHLALDDNCGVLRLDRIIYAPIVNALAGNYTVRVPNADDRAPLVEESYPNIWSVGVGGGRIMEILPPNNGMLLCAIREYFCDRGMNWIIFYYKDYSTGEVQEVTVNEPEGGLDAYRPSLFPCSLPDETRRTMYVQFGSWVDGGPIKALSVIYDTARGDGVRSFDKVISYNLDWFLREYFTESPPKIVTNPGEKFTRPTNCTGSPDNFWCLRDGAYAERLVNRYCSLPEYKSTTPCHCINPALAPITSDVGIDYAIAAAATTPIVGRTAAGCISFKCRAAITSTVSDYLITRKQVEDAKECGSQTFNTCSVAITTINSGSVQVDLKKLVQKCGFSRTNPPPECKDKPAPAICDRVYEASEGGGGDGGGEEKTGFPWWGYLIIGLVAAILIIGIIVYAIRSGKTTNAIAAVPAAASAETNE